MSAFRKNVSNFIQYLLRKGKKKYSNFQGVQLFNDPHSEDFVVANNLPVSNMDEHYSSSETEEE